MQHVALRRIDDHSANSNHQISGDDRTGDLFVEAQMTAGVAWCMKCSQPPARIALELDEFIVFDKSVDSYGVSDSVGGQAVRGNRHSETTSKVGCAADVIRVQMGQYDF